MSDGTHRRNGGNGWMNPGGSTPGQQYYCFGYASRRVNCNADETDDADFRGFFPS